jgi:CubicO group peptidase (beta-lactamase class C family)
MRVCRSGGKRRREWGLSFLLDMQDSPNGRSAGSMTWAGLANTYFWVDRMKRIGHVIMTQILPFGDPVVLDLYEKFEQTVYGKAWLPDQARRRVPSHRRPRWSADQPRIPWRQPLS